MKRRSLDYYRRRAVEECEAALNSSSRQARHAHAEIAKAYQRLVQVAELEDRGEIEPGKVSNMADVLHERDETEFGRRARKGAEPDTTE